MNTITSIDISILYFIQENLRFDWLNPIVCFVTNLGNSGIIWVVFGLALLIPKKSRPAGIAVLGAVFIGFILTNVLIKPMVARPRPYFVADYLVPIVPKPSEFSFPSGHATSSMAAGIAAFRVMVWPGVPARRHLSVEQNECTWLRIVGICALVLAIIISLSRLYVGVHYPTDILGGLAVALVANVVVWAIMKLGYKC